VLISIALAALGTFVLVRYVQGAEERALAGEETVEVLVVNTAVPRGSAAGDLNGKVDAVLVPAKVQAPGSVGDLAVLEGTYAAVDLVPGEQLLASRFVSAEEFVAADDFAVPDGLLAVTLSLSPDRALGGELHPGDEVAVIASFDPFTISEEETRDAQVGVRIEEAIDTTIQESEEGVTERKTPSSTHLIIHGALVTNVQVERLPAATDEASAEQSGLELAPTGNLLVTLAMEPVDVERTVFTAEFGLIWLAHESDTPVDEPTEIQTRATIYIDAEKASPR
jgi:pilus assembly protein CpaB